MIKRIGCAVLFLLMTAWLVISVSSEVITKPQTAGYGEYVYVAGSHDEFPFEYYDEETETYKGIIPDMLKKISSRTGIDFVYINGDKKDKELLSDNLQVEAVSWIGADEISEDMEYFELLSYESDGNETGCGIAFTSLMDEERARRIKTAANAITTEDKNGIYLSYASRDSSINHILIAVFSAVVLLLTASIVFLIVRITKMKKENESDKMTDPETGMGNLQHFKYHFNYTIGDISRNLYNIAYIVLDSSYLRSYHGDNSFEDILKHTAFVLNENTGDREICARITENGFAFAFQSVNEDDAKKRLYEIINRLNSFEQVKKNDKLIFHCASYRLQSTDKNCELLLFNLRKNCNKIFGTDTQIIFCDVFSMNQVQEEKKITENILKGFDNNEFKIYLQFVVDNRTKNIISAEALSRWENKEKGLLGPGKYIQNMETAGLISKHDFYMFEKACSQLEKWSDTEFSDISISCNFTRITLSEANFVDKISMIANSYYFDKSKLAIEITEDAIEKDREIATQNVVKCKELGFMVYLDDLGSGYTSLANLCNYPIDVVKIDRDILLKSDSEKGRELFCGIVALAHSMNIKVICEGVETEEQNELVSNSDCDLVQGWYYSKVLPIEECESFVKRHIMKFGLPTLNAGGKSSFFSREDFN